MMQISIADQVEAIRNLAEREAPNRETLQAVIATLLAAETRELIAAIEREKQALEDKLRQLKSTRVIADRKAGA